MIIEGSNTSNLTFNVIQLHFKCKVKIYTLVFNKFPNVRVGRSIPLTSEQSQLLLPTILFFLRSAHVAMRAQA